MLDLPDVDGLVVAFDTETSGLHIDSGARLSVVSLAWHDDDAGRYESRVWAFDQGEETWLGRKQGLPKKFKGAGLFDLPPDNHELDDWYQLTEWLGRQLLIGHNSKYDYLIFKAGLRGRPETGVDLSSRYHWDTQIVTSLIWPTELVSLKATAGRLWGAQESANEKQVKLWLKNNLGKQQDWRYDLVPWDIMGPYAEQDALVTIKLYDEQVQDLEEGLVEWHIVERELDFNVVLTRMEMLGVGFDREAAMEAGRVVYDLERAAGERLAAAVGSRVVPTENYMRDFWFFGKGTKTVPGALNLKPIKVTEDGKPQVTLDVVRELVKQGVQGAAEYQELNKLSTARSMWYEPWPRMCGEDNRLRCVFHQTKWDDDRSNARRGTISGRLAVERIQLQAIPHNYQCPPGVPPVRSFFKARPGYVVYELDLKQAEVRVAAAIAKCHTLMKALNDGDDPHSLTCRLMFDIDEDHPDWDFNRQVSKRLVFGNIYGAGAGVIAAQILQFTGQVVSVEQCERFLDTFRKVYPELGRAGKRQEYFAMRHQYVELAGGRRRWFRFGESTHKAWNAVVQGGVAELIKMAMIDIEVKHPWSIICQIHDSVWIEAPADRAEEIVGDARRIIESTFSDYYDNMVVFSTDSKQWGK